MKPFSFSPQSKAHKILALPGLFGSFPTGSALAANVKSDAVSRPQTASDTASAIGAQRAWWTAFFVADAAHLETRSAPQLSLTISGGQTYDRTAMIAEGGGAFAREKPVDRMA